MTAIGGYFELELRKGEHYHKGALRLNTARNCFEYILRARGYRKVYIPYYTCEVMLEPLQKCNVSYEFYHIDKCLEPAKFYNLLPDEAFLYTNYYGLKQRCVERLALQYGSQLIVDNAQAFYAKPIEGIDTFYSPRKFFGVPDGAYLHTTQLLNQELEQDRSYQRMSHLLIRADIGAEAGYEAFRKNDDSLKNNPIRKMSNLTEKILCSIDYDGIRQQRRANYQMLDDALATHNLLHFLLETDDVPMVYPFYSENMLLRQHLIANKIFVATYWKNVTDWVKKNNIEDLLVEKLLPLPINTCWRGDINRIKEIIERHL